MPVGRPTKYSDEVIEKAEGYLKNYRELGDMIPSVVGLADELCVTQKTLYNWSEKHPKFLHMLERINARQHRTLLSGGLSGEMNSNITKLVLAKHDYSDKQAVDATSSDGSMTPQVIERVIIKPDHGS
jgi:hypothetical protein